MIAIIFDMDGVLVDTIPLHYRSWKVMMDELGIPFDRAMNETLRGLSRMSSLRRILGEQVDQFSKNELKGIARSKNEMFLDEAQHLTSGDLMPGVRDLLASLKAAGHRLAVASSSKNAVFIVERLGIRDVFDAFVDGNDLSSGKPDPEVFLKAADALGVPPAHCVVIEDAESGVEAARRAGMACVGLGHHLTDADLRVSSLEHLTPATLVALVQGRAGNLP